MALAAPAKPKINTNPTQPGLDRAARRAPGGGKTALRGLAAARVGGDTRDSVRDSARLVIEVEWGITVYPPEGAGEPWRAVFTEGGRRRFRHAVTEAELAAKLAKVTERLRACAPDMERPGADLIAHYLDPDRLPVAKRWSRRHADTQRRLCQRFAAPVIAAVSCQDITVGHMQRIVSAAPTAREGERLHRFLSQMKPVIANYHQASWRPLAVGWGSGSAYICPGTVRVGRTVWRAGRQSPAVAGKRGTDGRARLQYPDGHAGQPADRRYHGR
jgi:hypothetical protein